MSLAWRIVEKAGINALLVLRLSRATRADRPNSLPRLHHLSFVACVFPRLNTALHRINSGNTKSLQLEGHTGTRGLAWSAAVKNNVAILGDTPIVSIN